MPQQPDPYVLVMLRILAAPLSEVPGVGLAIFLHTSVTQCGIPRRPANSDPARQTAPR